MKNEASSHRSIPVYAGSHAGRSRIWRSLCCLCAVLGSAAANKKWMSDYRTNRVEATVDTEDRFSGSPLSLDLHKSSHKCPQYYLLGQMKCSTTTLFKHLRHELDFPGWGKDKQKSLHIFDQHDAGKMLQASPELPPIDGTPSMFRALDAPIRLKALCNFKAPPKFVITLCDPANRTWSHFKHSERSDQQKRSTFFESQSRPKLDDDTLADAYRQCIRTTLPQLKTCLSSMSFLECGHMLYGSTTPGSWPDSLGNDKPCNGVIFSSMHNYFLENWFSVFPREDFLVLSRDDWIRDQPRTVKAVSKFFKVPFKKGQGHKIDPYYYGNHHEQFDDVPVPEDVHQELQRFFDEHSGWEKHVRPIAAAHTHKNTKNGL